MPTLEELGVRIHSDLELSQGPADCDGELVVIDELGDWVQLGCMKCQEETAVKRPPDLSWQDRADLR